MTQGADAVVLSLHKTFPALTQTALLLTNNEDLIPAIRQNIAVFQTSSPSYILMASVESCLSSLNNSKAFLSIGSAYSGFMMKRTKRKR